jgi:hypothetical protein
MSWQRSLRRVSAIESWKRAREVYNALVHERDALKQELEMFERENEVLREQLAESQATTRQMQAATLARYECWQELVALQREREIERAHKAERTFETTLH